MELPTTMDIAPHILYEDEYIVIVNKPSGLMVEPDRNGHPNLLRLVKNYLAGKSIKSGEVYAQHIHRLDRPVSGIVLFAKKREVLRNLSEQFAQRRVKKIYKALTKNAPEVSKESLLHWHRKEKKKAVLYQEQIPFAEFAKLSYVVIPYQDSKFEWTIELHTGKFHQIRVQLASLNCPIIGDALYGSDVSYKENCIALHAALLSFNHPISNERLVIENLKEWDLP